MRLKYKKLAAKKKATKKRPVRKTLKKPTTKKTSSSKTKKKPFGGYTISFAGRKETVEQVFGKKPIPPSQMTKKIWAFVKAKNLSKS